MRRFLRGGRLAVAQRRKDLPEPPPLQPKDRHPVTRTGPDQSAVILVVERNPHVRALETYFLEEAGYRVEFAEDGQKALDMVDRTHPHIVITEILVPGMDGLTLCREIKAREDLDTTKVLIFSILAAAGRAREAGADAFLHKPLAERRLVDTVEQLLELRTGEGG